MKIKYCLLLSLVLYLSGCSPEEDYYIDVDYNRIGYVLSDNSDNFNMSKFNAALRRTGLDKTLLDDGPFTVLVPTDAAFTNLGYATSDDVYAASGETLGRLVNYHILNGQFDLNRLPFLFGQEIPTRSGKPIYVTRWITESDTLLMINGIEITAVPFRASNGLIMVMSKAMNTTVHDNLNQVLKDDERVSIFSHAVQRSGLGNILSEAGSYTVFAPSNSAMASYGFASVQAVDSVDPAELAAIVRYHIMPERRFQNDIKLTMSLDDGEVSYSWFFYTYYGVQGMQYGHMLDGSTVTFKVVEYREINWLGPIANPTRELSIVDISNTPSTLSTANQATDIVAGNGIMHIVENVFRKTK